MYGRENDFTEMHPGKLAYYDDAITVDLSKVEPMIALPFHPSNVYKLKDVIENPYDILKKVENDCKAELNNDKLSFSLTDKIVDGKVRVSQGVIAGCAGGTYDNIALAANVLKGASTGNGAFSLNVYPGSMPVYLDLMKKGSLSTLVEAGAVIKPCFCGPCFGAGDTPSNNGLSIRHTTRNFENREGSKPSGLQIASVALMDARSIAATARNGGVLTSAMDVDYDDEIKPYEYDDEIYEKRVYNGWRNPLPRGTVAVRSEYQGLATDRRASRQPYFASRRGNRRRRDHHGRTYSVGRNVKLPLEPPKTCGVYFVQKMSRLRTTGKENKGGSERSKAGRPSRRSEIRP